MSDYVARLVNGRNVMPRSDDADFATLLRDIEDAMTAGVVPTRNAKGTSGNYIMRNTDLQPLAIFKPQNEEPFAPHNPRWSKFLQRHCCFCCFGRSCLLDNCGYLSEAGASVVDDFLGLGVVPPTRVVHLCSDAFTNPDGHARAKVGSLQTFVSGYRNAAEWFREWQSGSAPLTKQLDDRLLVLMQKMIVLDYVTRNTDRSSDNWMILYEPPTAAATVAKDAAIAALAAAAPAAVAPAADGRVEVAVIDNGLSFPVRHPIQIGMRSFPFYWASLPRAHEPFSSEVGKLIWPKLTDPMQVLRLCRSLRDLFKCDSGYNRENFEHQMNVMRGQLWNLRHAILHGLSPHDLAEAVPVSLPRKPRRRWHHRRKEAAWCDVFHVRAVTPSSCAGAAC